MSEANEKEPGQVACEVMSTRWRAFGAWPHIDAEMRAAWADTERELRERIAAPLEAETRDLHRQLSELRVEAQAQRAGRVEAEHQRDVLMGRVGREVTAALVAAVPAKVADVLTGAQHIDEAMQKALDDAVARAERAERERDESVVGWRRERADRDAEQARAKDAIERHSNLLSVLEDTVKRSVGFLKERDEARAEVARLTKAAEDAEDAVTGRLDAAFKDGASRMQAEIDRLKAKSTARGQRSRYECVTPAGTLYLDDPDANGVQFREAVRYAFASLTPRPDAGLAGLAEREAAEVKVERRPPFAWSDEDRAKLVPGASVMIYGGGEMRRIVVQESNGYVINVRGTPHRVAMVSDCDPATIEPPATQAESVRPPAPDLRRADRVTGHSGTEWRVAGSPQWNEAKQRWDVPMSGVLLDMVPAAGLDISTRVRTWQRGEVVPYAPPGIARQCTQADFTRGFTHGQYAALPLAEPWTQKGV